MIRLLSHRPRRRPFQSGFSLVELMIAVTLGLLIMTGLVAIFAKNSRARAEIELSSRQIENGRYATAVLNDDLRMAGYLSSFDPYSLIIRPLNPPLNAMVSMPDPCDTSQANVSNSFFIAVQGIDNAATIPSCLSDVRPGSDILVIRRASTCIAGPVLDANCDAPVSGANFYFQSSDCYKAGELYTTTPSSTDYQLHFVLDSNIANLSKHAIDCTTIANYRRFITRIYFVANNNVESPPDGIPTLKRAELGAPGATPTIVPIVDGIETLQLEYGVDANDDGVIDAYTTDPGTYNSCAGNGCVLNWLRTYAVKVHILARNTQASTGFVDTKAYTLGQKFDGSDNVFGPYNDSYKRHAYSTTVRLLNPSGRKSP